MPKIMIVDDEWLTRLEIEEMLTDLGYEVAGQAETGEEAVAMARKLNPDLILMDVDMPGGINGIDAAREIKAESGTPIVFISGYGDPEYIEAAKEIEPFGYVMKPFDEKEVHAFVEIALSKRALELKLKKAHESLEQRVEIRTAELAEANKQLKRENEAHKRTVATLRESENKLNAVLDAATETIVLFDRKGIVHVANKTACDRLGTTKEEIFGKNLYDFFSPEVGEGRRQRWNKVFETGKPVFFEDSRAGTMFEQVAYPVLGEGDQVKMIVAFANDKTDRMQAQEALRENEKHFQSFMEDAKGFAVYRLKLDPENYYGAQLVFVSPSFEEVVGVSPEENYSRWFKDVHEDDLPSIINAQKEFSQLGLPLDQEFRVKGPEGAWRWLHAIANPVFDSEGKPEYYNAIIIDVTAHKEAEQALRESERKYRLFIENAGEGIIISQEGRLSYANPRIADFLGHDQEKIEGKSIFEFVHPEDRKYVSDLYHKKLKGGDVPLGASYRLIDSQGDVKWVQSRSNFIKSDGETGLLTFLIDITDLKAALAAAETSEAKHRILFDNSPYGICIVQDGKLRFANHKLLTFSGFSPDEISNEKFLDFIHPSHRQKVAGFYLKRIAGEDVPDSYCVKAVDKAGREYDIEINSNLIEWEGRPATLNFIRDITLQKQMEEDLKQAQKMEAIGNLAGGIAHEFNNVLGIILGNAELAMDDVPDWNPAKESLREIRSASFRAKEVVRQILSFARKSMTALKPLEINTVIKESLKLMRASIPTMIDIQLNIPTEPKMIMGDPTEIHQIVINLCTNSAHAMQKTGGTLHVGISNAILDEETASAYEDLSPGEYVRLTVKDSGEGIPSDILEKVMEPYFTTKEFGAGSGMGLAVVYGLVKRCKGAIKIESAVGEGTSAEILFPKIEDDAPSVKAAKGELPKGNERVLLIDDDSSIVKMIRQMLERLGYIVSGMTDSIAALERFRSAPGDFDLVITDMAMPNLSGDQLAAELLKVRKDIPILLCTGHSDTIDEKKAKELGIRAFAMKPLDKEKLAKAVRGTLDGG